MFFTPIKPPKKLFDSSVPKKISKRRHKMPPTPYRQTTRSHYHQSSVLYYGEDPEKTQAIVNDIKSMNINTLRTIGTGSFAKVYLVPQYNLSLKVFPVHNKLRSRNNLLSSLQIHLDLFKNSEMAQNFGSIQKQFLLKTQFVYEEKCSFYLGSNFCEGGNLDEFVVSSIRKNQKIQTFQIYEILCDLLIAVDLLHLNRLIHMDIKPENILRTKGFHILCDFGCMAKLNQEYTIEGDSRFLAPEIFKGSKLAKTDFDIYSIGATIYQLAAGDLDLPTEGEYYNTLHNVSHDTNLIYRCERSEDLKYLINSMMLSDPNSRVTLSDLLQNKIIKELLPKRIELAKKILKNNSTLKKHNQASNKEPNQITNSKLNSPQKNNLFHLFNSHSFPQPNNFNFSPMAQNTLKKKKRKKKKHCYNFSKNLFDSFNSLENMNKDTKKTKNIKNLLKDFGEKKKKKKTRP
ncbi:membrane-associated tyrosine- and threonine-specific cdc2-inhibitory kinase [Anaeramoeba flamelloides]|uniref:non-specific serine/threonine protein kinase n=1 Tax=Anaeramoeba flamelloides TaxID=1746091 RepID=A0AAV7ZLA6_9EUKA|nr:membrane-associated tyrosine- and threonine-specific cdc2-inhibitory kinase [Anaeramoeba flamelloides]